MHPAQAIGWPLSEHSRQVRARPHDWHVQQAGSGPDILLLHGTGAATHSWRDVFPLLTPHARVTAVDLPGHGFTRMGTRMRSSLDCVAEDLLTLCKIIGVTPELVAGHSAGAAIALRMAQKLDNSVRVVGINPALKPFEGLAGMMFPVAARMMAMTPGLARTFARQMRSDSRVERLLQRTGSTIPPEQVACYAHLFRDPAHVEGVLAMMAQWKLDGLVADLPKLDRVTLFLTGSRDRMVSPIAAVQAASTMPRATVQSLDGYGHLVHEEAPEPVARRLLSAI